MAAHEQKKEQKQKTRVGPGLDSGSASRVSKAAGNLGSESMRVEQRAKTPSTKQRSQNSSPSKRPQGNNQGAKKGRSTNRPGSASTPADSRLIGNLQRKWQSLGPHGKQTLLSVLLLIISLLLFGALTLWHSLPIFGALDGFFLTFFGWGAYLLILGLIAFAIAHCLLVIERSFGTFLHNLCMHTYMPCNADGSRHASHILRHMLHIFQHMLRKMI